MTDTDKILQVLARLEAGQQALQGIVNQQGKAITNLQEGQQIMQQDIKSLQEGQKALQTDVKGLQTDVKSLKEGQQTLELKVEVFHAEQTKANTQILTILTDMNEINEKAMDTRVTWIEKHLSLPPIK